MPHVRLKDSEEYELEYEEQDIRGWDVLDGAGDRIGRVDDMIVDTDEERVDTIVLEGGASVSAANIYISDDAVYLDAVVEYEAVRPLVDVHENYGTVRRIGSTKT